MNRNITAGEYLTLGERIYFLCNETKSASADKYEGHIRKVIEALDDYGFLAASAAAKYFETITIPRTDDGHIGRTAAVQITEIAETMARVLFYEAKARQTITVNGADVSKQLREVASVKTLTIAQADLMAETIRCIECGAYRAAAVMGWNLAFDYIRQWVFDNKITELNAALIRKFPKKTKPPQITRYQDFFALTERVVIDAMAESSTSAPIIGEEVRDHLVHYLRHRNKYAHPTTEKSATAAKTNAYIEHLIDIITAAPFA